MRRQNSASKIAIKAGLGKLQLKFLSGSKVKSKVLTAFTRQLATLIDAGLPLLRGLDVLRKGEKNPVLKRTLGQLAEAVEGGSTFSEALAQHPKIYNKLYVNMVRAGEAGGVLDVTLTRLADFQEKAQKIKNKVISAMVYPTVVIFVAVSIVTFLMIVIVPKFQEIFRDLLAALQGMIGGSAHGQGSRMPVGPVARSRDVHEDFCDRFTDVNRCMNARHVTVKHQWC